MSNAKVKVGLIGCGNISRQYCTGMGLFDILEIVACADIEIDRAEALAAEFNIPRVYSPEQLLADPEIQIVVNLTIPAAHAAVNMAALQAGKHAYCEKPFAVHRPEGQKVLALAEEKGLLVGCAPETFMGGGLQTCRKLIDDGWIGQPIAASAFMMGHGPEGWHPNPDFFYQVGGGPMFDMGPYYLTALVHLLGPIKKVAGFARSSFPERIITNANDRYGERIPVEVPTHVSGSVEFASGAIGSLIISFDVWGSHLPRIEIYGSEGTLAVPDPNTFGGPIFIKKASPDVRNRNDWEEIPLTYNANVKRGIGVADMAYALTYNRPHRVSGTMAYHVLDLMHAFYDASEQETTITVSSTCDRPALFPVGLLPGTLDQ